MPQEDYIIDGDSPGNLVYELGDAPYYVIPEDAVLKLVYNFDTSSISLDNDIQTTLAAAITEDAETLTVRAGDGNIFIAGMVCTLEEFNSEGKVVAREIIRINTVAGDTLSIVRGAGSTVMDDTANPKVLGNTHFGFSAGAKISLYFGKEAIKIEQNNIEIAKGNNCCILTQTQALDACVDNRYDAWIDCLICQIAKCCHGGDKGFGSGCDGNCTMSGNVFLCANREYQFNNLTINSGACVRFEGQGVPTIRVKHCFCNKGVIDLRGGTFVGCCSYSDVYIGTSVQNNADQTAYNDMCFGCGGAAGTRPSGGCAGCNATAGRGGDGGGNSGNCYDVPPTCASGYNGGNGGEGDSCARNGWQCGSGGGGGGWYTGNGGNGGDGASGSTSDSYSMDGGNGGKGGNGGIWGTGGCGGRGGVGYASGDAGDGGNGYIGGNGGDEPGGKDCMSGGYAGTGGNGIIQGGKGGNSYKAMGTKGGKGGNAINNMYGFVLYACSIYNNVICGKGGQGGDGGCNTMPSSYTHGGGNGGCGANGGCVIVGYYRLSQTGTIDVSGGCGGAGGTACGGTCNYGCPGTNGTAGSCKVRKIF